MGTNQNENETDQELDKRLKCACGWDEEQLLKELEDAEKEMIRKSLERNNGKRKKTAEELKISERTLYRKIKEYNLE